MPDRCDRCGRRDGAGGHECGPVSADVEHAIRRLGAAADDLRHAARAVDAPLAAVALNAADRIERAAAVLHVATRRGLRRRTNR